MKSYSANAKKHLLNIFSKHDIKLQFENPSDLYNALNECISESTKIHVDEIRKQLHGAEMKEYDIFKRKYLSNILGYEYAQLNLVANEKIAKQITQIRNLFYYFDGLLDLASPFAISYVGDTKVIEGYYYSFSYKNLIDQDDNFVEKVYDSMSLSEKTRCFLRNVREQDKSYFSVHYLAFDINNNPRKIRFRTNVSALLKSNIKDIYSDYKLFDEVVKLYEGCGDSNHEVGLQFVPDRDYFGLDINVPSEDCIQAVNCMLKDDVVKEDDFNYMKTLVLQAQDMNVTNITWKYRWANKEKFTIKQYHYFDNENRVTFLHA